MWRPMLHAPALLRIEGGMRGVPLGARPLFRYDRQSTLLLTAPAVGNWWEGIICPIGLVAI